MVKKSKIRVRIAPAPTGMFHIGTARTALFNYLFAKKQKGDFILRIEDTDKDRSKLQYEKDIMESLSWLGIEWDEKYKQSERIKIYEKYLKKLLDSGAAYKKDIIWFKNPNKKVVFNDLVRGEVEFDSSMFGDFSLAKSLKEPLYNFAAVIDDYEMKISHVIRGEDHISNTPKQILIYKALGLPVPKFAHLPLILGSDKSKLSKRHGAVSIADYKKQGYLPEVMINFMVLLGWSAQTGEISPQRGGHPKHEDIFSLKQLIKEFSLEKVQKGGAVFNIDKLDWFNSYYIKKMPIKELTKLCLPYLPKSNFSKSKLEKIIKLEQERIKKIPEIGDMVEFFFKEPKYKASLLKWPKTPRVRLKEKDKKEIIDSLDKLKEMLSKLEIGEFEKKLLKMEDRGKFLWPLRVALTGREKSPGPFEIIEILGKKQSLKRIEKAIKLLK